MMAVAAPEFISQRFGSLGTKEKNKEMTKGVDAMHEACKVGGLDGAEAQARRVERITHLRHCK
jgi:hypothetical protein